MTHTSASKIRNTFLTCAIVLSGLSPANHALAQDPSLTVKVPFAFQNGSQHLPAGAYRIDLQSEHRILLRGPGNHASGFAMTNPQQRTASSMPGKVVFRRYGGNYFLSEVWASGDSIGRKCVKSRAEKQLQIAQTTVAPSNVELALNTLPW